MVVRLVLSLLPMNSWADVYGPDERHRVDLPMHTISQLIVEEKHVPTLPVEQKSIKVEKDVVKDALPLVSMSPNVSYFNQHVGTTVNAPAPTNEAGWRTTRTGTARRRLELDAHDSFLDTQQENILAKLAARKEDPGVLPTTKCNIACCKKRRSWSVANNKVQHSKQWRFTCSKTFTTTRAFKSSIG
ncbi:unnamed protein product [Calypogeia fissa]